jgi:hypothetical protein
MIESVVMNLIALSADGRKFSNCTGIKLGYEVEGGSFIIDREIPPNWT